MFCASAGHDSSHQQATLDGWHRQRQPGTHALMRIGSGPFIGLLVVVAFAAVGAGVRIGSTPLEWCSVVIGAYAMHLLATRFAVRSATASLQSADRRADEQDLDSERDEVERLKRELERKLVQTEEQWVLLRSMVQERLQRPGKSTTAAPPAESEPQSTPGGPGGRAMGARPGSDESGRSYGRW